MAGIPRPSSSTTGASSSLPIRPQSAGASASSGALRNAETGTGAQPLAAGTAGVVVERKSLFARVLDTARDVGRVLTGKVWEEALESGLAGGAEALQDFYGEKAIENSLKKLCKAAFAKSNDEGIAFVNNLTYEDLSMLLGISEAPTSPNDTFETRREAVIVNYCRDSDGDAPLIVASKNGNVEELRHLLSLPGIDVNIRNSNGDTALILAVVHGQADVVDALIAHAHIDVNARNNDNISALNLVSSLLTKPDPQWRIFTALLNHNDIDVNTRNAMGETILHSAVRMNRTDMVDALLAHKDIDISVRNNRGYTPLTLAVHMNQKDIVSALLHHRDRDGNVPLIAASKNGNIEELRQLLSLPGIDLNVVDANGDTALVIAKREGKNEAVTELLKPMCKDAFAKSNHEGIAFVNSLEYAELSKLLGLREEPISYTDTLETRRKTAIANYWRNEHKDPFLIYCAWNGKTRSVKRLLALPGIDLNVVNPDGDTALVVAEKGGRNDIVPLLLEASKTDPLQLRNIVDSSGISYQHSNLTRIADQRSFRYDIFQYLLKNIVLKAEYHATILGNFISLSNIRLPDQTSEFSRLGRILRHGGGSEKLSLNYLIAAWDDFQKLSFNAKYIRLEAPIKAALETLITSWKNNHVSNNDALSAAVQNGKPCSWTVHIPGHLMGMSVRGDQLIFSNVGGVIDLASGKKTDQKKSLLGEMVFDISKHRSLFTADFIGKLRDADAEALEALYKLPKVGYIGKRGQNRGNCAFDHPKLFIENHIYFEFLKEEERLSSSPQSSSSSAASSSSASSSSSSREAWESTSEINRLRIPHDIELALPSREIVPSLNHDPAVKHARRIFRDFTLFARIKALADFANDPHAVEYMRAILPEEHKGEAERLVNEAVMEGWKKISEMIQKRTAYKAAEEPDWTKRGYNTVEGGSLVDGLLAQLGDDPQTDAAKLLRDAIIEAKTKEGAT